MKIIIYSDIHLHDYNRYSAIEKSRLDICLSCLDFIYSYALDNDIDTVLFAGDMFNVPSIINTETFIGALNILKQKKYAGITTYAISGNHDHSGRNTWEKPCKNSIMPLAKSLKNFHLVDNSIIEFANNKLICGIPYYRSMTDFNLAIEQLLDQLSDADLERHSKYLLLHQTPGEISNKHIKSDFSLKNKIFKEFDYIFCGHIHKHEQLTSNAVMVGSPLHRDLDDLGLEKGILVFDTVKLTYKFVNSNMPEFKRDLKDANPNDYIIPEPKLVLNKTNKITKKRFNSSLDMKTLMLNFAKDKDLKNESYLNIINEII